MVKEIETQTVANTKLTKPKKKIILEDEQVHHTTSPTHHIADKFKTQNDE